MSAPVFLTGSSGFLGPYLLNAAEQVRPILLGLRNAKAIPETSRSSLWKIPVNLQAVPFDLEDPEACYHTLMQHRPGAVLHVAAMADTGACERDPERSLRINVKASAAIARACAEMEITLVCCSTDLVFGGDKAPYRPADKPDPLMVYGQHKAEAERAVQNRYPQSLIARLPLLYGLSALPGRGLVRDMANSLRQGKALKLFSDEYRSMAYARDVARQLWELLDSGKSGVVHLGGPKRLSRYDFGLAVARAGGWSESLIVPVEQASVSTGTARPKDVTLIRD